jgi:hypothetical protein
MIFLLTWRSASFLLMPCKHKRTMQQKRGEG